MILYGLFWGLQPGLVVQIRGGHSDHAFGLLMYPLVVGGLRAKQEAPLTPGCLWQEGSSGLARAKQNEKSRCSLGSLVVTNRKNRTMSLDEGTGW